MTDIKPRYDDDGVPWCDSGCEHFGAYGNTCGYPDVNQVTDVCPHAARRMAVELEAWRSGRLAVRHRLYEPGRGFDEWEFTLEDERVFDTIDDAVDALMEEE